MLQLSPSILTADFAHLADDIAKVEAGGADMLHVDIMDGHFVPNMSMGPSTVKTLKKITKLPLDVHLMIDNPEAMIPAFAKAGADIITVHYEACPQLMHTLSMIREFGCKVGVSLCPGTPLCALDAVLADVDMVLLMTVNPGFGGQGFIESSPARIKELRAEITKRGLVTDIEVDGGIKLGNLQTVIDAGANVFVVGSAIFDGEDTEGNARRVKELMEKQ